MFSVHAADGQVYGPVDTATIRQWIADGRVTPETILVDSVTDRQAPARDVIEFVDAFMAPPAQGSAGSYAGTTTQTSSGYSPNTGYTQGHLPGAASYPAYAGGGAQISHRNKVVAALLAFFLGAFGIHRFYLGYTTIGIIMLVLTIVTCGFAGIITGIWAIVDMIMILTGSLKDAEGRELAS